MSHQRSIVVIPARVDGLIALTFLVGVVCWANHQHILESGIIGFLGIRITLLNAVFTIAFSVLWKICMEALGLYRRNLTQAVTTVTRVAAACSLMTGFLIIYLKLREAEEPINQIAAIFLLLTFLYELCRVLLSNRQIWQTSEHSRVVILGSGRLASKAWRELRTRHHHTKELLGFFDERLPNTMPPDMASRFLGQVADLPEFMLKNIVDELIVATPMRSCYDFTQRAISIAETAGVRVVYINDAFNLSHGNHLRRRASLFVDLVPVDQAHESSENIKRIIDVILAAIGLLVTAPLFLVIGLGVKLTSSGPAFFVQQRYGLSRRSFAMYKFRSMVQDAPHLLTSLEALNETRGPIFKMTNDPRITPFGRFLRRTSLDELPQLWNVVRGDMSLVGPRPMCLRDVSLFNEVQLMRRFSVRPGITGSWQVSARSSLNFDQWMTLDCSYVDNWSLALDLSILAKTIPAVLKRSAAI